MNSVKVWLEGKKSYIVALATLVDGLYQYYVQHNSDWHALVAYLLAGGAIAAIRGAIAKAEGK